MDFSNDPNSLNGDRLVAMLSGDRVPAPPRIIGNEFINPVQRILKENIPDVDSDEDSETGPNHYWKTFVYALQQPPKFAQLARCLVKTVIDNGDTIAVRHRVQLCLFQSVQLAKF